MYYWRSLLFILVLVISVLSSQLPVLSVENDLGLWTNINLKVPITNKIETRFQFSPRLVDNITDFNQFVTHGTLGYKLNKNFSIWQGYAWSTTYIPNFRREQRIYNDIVYESTFKKLELENRFRLEERFLQSVEGVSLRGRYRLKASYPIDRRKKWRVVFIDEIFTNFNSHFNGPQAGLDQNRIYLGLNKRFNEHFNLDGGYQLQHLHRESNDDKLNHFIMFKFNFILPQLIKKKELKM